jgi:hypothetical protein
VLKKSRRSAWILAAACAAAIFLVLFLLQAPNLGNAAFVQATTLLGLVLFAATSFTYYTIIKRCDERYYGLTGLAGWVLTGLLMSLSLWGIQKVYPSYFGLLGIAVIGFFVFRWLSFWIVWKLAGLFKN